MKEARKLLEHLCRFCREQDGPFLEHLRCFLDSSMLYGLEFLKESEQEEEERRLFFVGITRARNYLELSYYTNPGEPGVLEGYSSYLRMLPEHLLDWSEIRSQKEKRDNLQELRREVAAQTRKSRGEPCVEKVRPAEDEVRRVRHRKYGEGTIAGEDEMMIEVEFEGYGRKQFLRALGEVEEIK